MKNRIPSSDPDLDSLAKQAVHYASHMMTTSRSVPPALMALTPSGFMMYVPKQLDDEKGKDNFANIARLIATGYEAVAVAMILESWFTIAKRPGQTLPDTPPSQSPEREEVIVVMAESRDASKQSFLFIQRNSSGQFTGFGASPFPQFDEMQGRFAGLIPPKTPGKNDVLMARMLLQAMGATLETCGWDPSWN